MKAVYEVDSDEQIHGNVKIYAQGNSIFIEQDMDLIFFKDTSAQDVIYALREIIGDK